MKDRETASLTADNEKLKLTLYFYSKFQDYYVKDHKNLEESVFFDRVSTTTAEAFGGVTYQQLSYKARCSCGKQLGKDHLTSENSPV